jgi:hypothetical protein
MFRTPLTRWPVDLQHFERMTYYGASEISISVCDFVWDHFASVDERMAQNHRLLRNGYPGYLCSPSCCSSLDTMQAFSEKLHGSIPGYMR